MWISVFRAHLRKRRGTDAHILAISSKSEARNSKQAQMIKSPNKTMKYDLEERTMKFARRVRQFVKSLPRTISNREDIAQLIRSSGSIGANYIEANESLSKKDFLMRIKICRKEAKESKYWLLLIDVGESEKVWKDREALAQEGIELMKIFGSIIQKSGKGVLSV